MSENRVIGKDGKLPWHMPADLKYFKELTSHHVVIMGRKTFDSFGKPLPDRLNVVVTQRRDYKPEGVQIVHSLKEGLEHAQAEAEAFILGGGEIFRQALPGADRIYLTIIHTMIDGDVFFPELDSKEWHLAQEDYNEPDEHNRYGYSFLRYERAGQEASAPEVAAASEPAGAPADVPASPPANPPS